MATPIRGKGKILMIHDISFGQFLLGLALIFGAFGIFGLINLISERWEKR